MGSNRAMPASASKPITVQIHTPSGLSSPLSPQIPVLDMSSSIKTEPSTHMDAAMNAHCHSENWVENYQDLSSWCSATSASSPATCLSPAIDESLTTDLDFQGEIDFDLRKSEEIASIPLEEDCGFNWGSESPLLGDNKTPPPPVPAITKRQKYNPVLLKDCWWSDIEKEKVVKELESSKPEASMAMPASNGKNHLNYRVTALPVVREDVQVDTKENLNPTELPQTFLSDPIKMAELQTRLERIASLTHPGVNSKVKAADLLRILQHQIEALNKKKYNSTAAITDLHNYSKLHMESGVSSKCGVSTNLQPASASVTSIPVGAESTDIFVSDPFDNLFPAYGTESNQISIQSGQEMISQNQQPSHSIVAAPVFISNSYQSNLNSKLVNSNVTSQASDLFSEAHHEIMRQPTKTQPVQNQPQLQVAPVSQPHTVSSMYQMPNLANRNLISVKRDIGLSIKMPPVQVNTSDLDFDALLFGSPGVISGGNRTPVINTPDVIKSLVETPDPESFDLLSYLDDDKLNTPPVSLDNNPFHFPQPSTSSACSTTTASESRLHTAVVRPMVSTWVKQEKLEQDLINNNNDSAVVVEVKPQIMPSPISVEEECRAPEFHGDRSMVEAVKEEQISPRPSRSVRRRKYSEDEFVLSPSTSDETPKSSKRRRSSSKYDSDEEFTLPVRKSRKKSVTTIIEEDEGDEVKPKRPRTVSVSRRSERTVSTSSENDRYRELRDRNNEASRKSRLTRKAREQELGRQAEVLTRENMVLKVKVEEMENLVKKLREALLQSMMKKSASLC